MEMVSPIWRLSRVLGFAAVAWTGIEPVLRAEEKPTAHHEHGANEDIAAPDRSRHPGPANLPLTKLR